MRVYPIDAKLTFRVVSFIFALSLGWQSSAFAAYFIKTQGSLTSAAFPTAQEFSLDPILKNSVGITFEIPASGVGFAPVIGNAQAHGIFGTLGARAQASSTNGDGRDYTVFGGGSFGDTLLITSAAPSGSAVPIDFKFSTSAIINSSSNLLTAGTLEVFNELRVTITQVRPGPDTRTQAFNLPLGAGVSELIVPFSIDVGETFEFTVGLQSNIRCRNCVGQWSAVADAANTVILDLIVGSGANPDPIHVQSLLGNSYANVSAVPIPAAGWMFAVAVGGGLMRRRSASQG